MVELIAELGMALPLSLHRDDLAWSRAMDIVNNGYEFTATVYFDLGKAVEF